jgi:mannose-6-phosphate isomerase-like protein (cupin superfamily)
MNTQPKSFDLTSTFVVLQPDQSATAVEVTPTLYEDLNKGFDGFRDRRLISSFSCERDWTMWEMHPAGDEIVYLLSGSVELVLERGDFHAAVRLAEPGAYTIIPKGTWHTAKTKVPANMLFVTPGEGTRHKPL